MHIHGDVGCSSVTSLIKKLYDYDNYNDNYDANNANLKDKGEDIEHEDDNKDEGNRGL